MCEGLSECNPERGLILIQITGRLFFTFRILIFYSDMNLMKILNFSQNLPGGRLVLFCSFLGLAFWFEKYRILISGIFIILNVILIWNSIYRKIFDIQISYLKAERILYKSYSLGDFQNAEKEARTIYTESVKENELYASGKEWKDDTCDEERNCVVATEEIKRTINNRSINEVDNKINFTGQETRSEIKEPNFLLHVSAYEVQHFKKNISNVTFSDDFQMSFIADQIDHIPDKNIVDATASNMDEESNERISCVNDEDERSNEHVCEKSAGENEEVCERDDGDNEDCDGRDEGCNEDSAGNEGSSEDDGERDEGGNKSGREGNEENKDSEGDGESSEDGEGDGESSEDGEGDGESSEDGEGDGESSEDGEGDGESSEEGEGDGESSEDGEGDGESSEDGEGDGESNEDGEGDGEGSEDGEGDGESSEDGEGDGESSEDGEGDGESREDGEGDGEGSEDGEGDGEGSEDGEGDGESNEDGEGDGESNEGDEGDEESNENSEEEDEERNGNDEKGNEGDEEESVGNEGGNEDGCERDVNDEDEEGNKLMNKDEELNKRGNKDRKEGDEENYKDLREGDKKGNGNCGERDNEDSGEGDDESSENGDERNDCDNEDDGMRDGRTNDGSMGNEKYSKDSEEGKVSERSHEDHYGFEGINADSSKVDDGVYRDDGKSCKGGNAAVEKKREKIKNNETGKRVEEKLNASNEQKRGNESNVGNDGNEVSAPCFVVDGERKDEDDGMRDADEKDGSMGNKKCRENSEESKVSEKDNGECYGFEITNTDSGEEVDGRYGYKGKNCKGDNAIAEKNNEEIKSNAAGKVDEDNKDDSCETKEGNESNVRNDNEINVKYYTIADGEKKENAGNINSRGNEEEMEDGYFSEIDNENNCGCFIVERNTDNMGIENEETNDINKHEIRNQNRNIVTSGEVNDTDHLKYSFKNNVTDSGNTLDINGKTVNFPLQVADDIINCSIRNENIVDENKKNSDDGESGKDDEVSSHEISNNEGEGESFNDVKKREKECHSAEVWRENKNNEDKWKEEISNDTINSDKREGRNEVNAGNDDDRRRANDDDNCKWVEESNVGNKKVGGKEYAAKYSFEDEGGSDRDGNNVEIVGTGDYSNADIHLGEKNVGNKRSDDLKENKKEKIKEDNGIASSAVNENENNNFQIKNKNLEHKSRKRKRFQNIHLSDAASVTKRLNSTIKWNTSRQLSIPVSIPLDLISRIPVRSNVRDRVDDISVHEQNNESISDSDEIDEEYVYGTTNKKRREGESDDDGEGGGGNHGNSGNSVRKGGNEGNSGNSDGGGGGDYGNSANSDGKGGNKDKSGNGVEESENNPGKNEEEDENEYDTGDCVDGNNDASNCDEEGGNEGYAHNIKRKNKDETVNSDAERWNNGGAYEDGRGKGEDGNNDKGGDGNEYNNEGIEETTGKGDYTSFGIKGKEDGNADDNSVKIENVIKNNFYDSGGKGVVGEIYFQRKEVIANYLNMKILNNSFIKPSKNECKDTGQWSTSLSMYLNDHIANCDSKFDVPDGSTHNTNTDENNGKERNQNLINKNQFYAIGQNRFLNQHVLPLFRAQNILRLNCIYGNNVDFHNVQEYSNCASSNAVQWNFGRPNLSVLSLNILKYTQTASSNQLTPNYFRQLYFNQSESNQRNNVASKNQRHDSERNYENGAQIVASDRRIQNILRLYNISRNNRFIPSFWNSDQYYITCFIPSRLLRIIPNLSNTANNVQNIQEIELEDDAREESPSNKDL